MTFLVNPESTYKGSPDYAIYLPCIIDMSDSSFGRYILPHLSVRFKGVTPVTPAICRHNEELNSLGWQPSSY